MRHFETRILCCTIAAAIASGAALAGASRRVVGQVDATSGVMLEGIAARAEDAIFTGDLLSTSAGASAAVKFAGARQVEVLPESEVRFELDGRGRPLAQISIGTVVATATVQRAVVVKTAKYEVHPAEGRRVVCFVAVLADHGTIIGARRGAVTITEMSSGATYLLAPGSYIALEAGASGLPPQQQEQNQQAPGKPAGQEAPPAPQPEKSVQAPGKAAGPTAPPPPKPAPPPWHIGSLSHGASVGLVIAVAAGAAGGAVAAASGGGGGAPASPSAP